MYLGQAIALIKPHNSRPMEYLDLELLDQACMPNWYSYPDEVTLRSPAPEAALTYLRWALQTSLKHTYSPKLEIVDTKVRRSQRLTLLIL